MLIIDDEEDIRFTISEICSLAGWEPITAANGSDGLLLYVRKKPDLVLVDHHMPRMDGLTTVKKMRELDKVTPILVLTVDERQKLADAYLDAGATDFALKPIKAPDLISRIKVNLRIGDLQKEMARKRRESSVDKGINNATLKIIVNSLQNKDGAVSIEEICQRVNLAYPTVHRYLQYLVENGRAGVEICYGSVSKRGRPKNKYYLVD
ncbi:MAG: response regulator [Peptococcaceae bacterium]|nr:response regulator [Peptococcaceae bacterium]